MLSLFLAILGFTRLEETPKFLYSTGILPSLFTGCGCPCHSDHSSESKLLPLVLVSLRKKCQPCPTACLSSCCRAEGGLNPPGAKAAPAQPASPPPPAAGLFLCVCLKYRSKLRWLQTACVLWVQGNRDCVPWLGQDPLLASLSALVGDLLEYRVATGIFFALASTQQVWEKQKRPHSPLSKPRWNTLPGGVAEAQKLGSIYISCCTCVSEGRVEFSPRLWCGQVAKAKLSRP